MNNVTVFQSPDKSAVGVVLGNEASDLSAASALPE